MNATLRWSSQEKKRFSNVSVQVYFGTHTATRELDMQNFFLCLVMAAALQLQKCIYICMYIYTYMYVCIHIEFVPGHGGGFAAQQSLNACQATVLELLHVI